MINFVVKLRKMDSIQILSGLFNNFFGVEPERIEAIPQAGSDRRYWRLSGAGYSAIGTFGPDREENRCFIALSKVFAANGCQTPRVYSFSEDLNHYIQEDLGEESLFNVLGEGNIRHEFEATIRCLVKIQKCPRKEWIECCQARPFSARQILWDLNYFKYEYLKPAQIIFDEDKLEDDYEQIANRLSETDEEFMGFMMRDCQSRNVMLTKHGPVMIDYQGGRLGPVLYDAISLLWQARAGLSADLRHKLLRYYAESYCGNNLKKQKRMLESAGDLILFRTLQVLGAYGFRGLVQHKAHFILSIPGALKNLRELLEEGVLDVYPELKRICGILVKDPRFVSSQAHQANKTLNVEIFSFSYKKGYPDDFSGNGGGFMFDCRAMHNPGRYERYKSLTGRDAPVIAFLEERGEVKSFLHGAWSMTDPAVERYLQRGFSNLQIGFGCTGGQHRSVYCAEKTAEHIRRLFPEALVNLTHREHPES